MWSVFLFARRLCWRCFGKCRWSCAKLLYAVWSVIGGLVALLNVAPCHATEGHASFASLLAGGLSPVGLGGYYSTPARYADPSYNLSYYWMDEVEESSWNLSLEFGSDAYRVGAFVAYQSMDSLYRNLYSEFLVASSFQVGAQLQMARNPFGGVAEWLYG